MKKIAIFVVNTETAEVNLHVDEINESYAKAEYGSVRNYLDEIYSMCKHTRVIEYRIFDDFRIDLYEYALHTSYTRRVQPALP